MSSSSSDNYADNHSEDHSRRRKKYKPWAEDAKLQVCIYNVFICYITIKLITGSLFSTWQNKENII